MSELEQALEAAENEIRGQSQEVEVEEQDDVNAEEEARRNQHALDMGWRPKEEWKGDPERWVDRDEFLERGEKIMPILQANNRRLQETLEKERKQLEEARKATELSKSEYEERFRRLEAVGKAAMERQQQQHEAQVRELAEQMRQAGMVDGDWDRYDKLAKQRDELMAKQPEAVSFDPPRQSQPQPDAQTAQAWVEQNSSWYGKDATLTGMAKAAAELAYLEGKSTAEQLKAAEAAVARKRPDLFPGSEAPKPAGLDSIETPAPEPKPARPAAAAAADGGSAAARLLNAGAKKRGVQQLPPEAKKAGEDFVAKGAFASMEDYAKAYWEQD